MTDIKGDARVAEAVGYEAWETKKNWLGKYALGALYRILRKEGSSPIERSIKSLKEDGYKKVSLASWQDVEGLSNHLRPLPFLTAPTHATDGIVLEWVQGQDDRLMAEFIRHLGEILAAEDRQKEYTGLWAMRFYKPGMYARALLAIEEARGE
jgi:hypothetical protein